MTEDVLTGFDFGLTPEQDARAARLHTESIVIDLMYWGPVSMPQVNDDMERHLKAAFEVHHSPSKAVWEAFELGGRLAVDGEYPEFQQAWEASGLTGGHYPLQVGSESELVRGAAHVARVVDGLPWVRKALSAGDFREAKKNGELAYFLQCQPVVPISRDLSLIDRAYDIGLRMLQLTYNDQDFVGAGCTERTNAGVTNFGKRVIKRCNDIGIVVDTGHCGKQTTLDACEFSTAPVVASHTCAEEVRWHARAKSDEEIRAIAATGGVVGVVTVPFFLGEADTTIEAMLDHIDYIAELVGWEHVAIGTDWPMTGPMWAREKLAEWLPGLGFRPEDKIVTTQDMVGFEDYRCLPNITRGLVQRGYTDNQIFGILGRNALRVFHAVMG